MPHARDGDCGYKWPQGSGRTFTHFWGRCRNKTYPCLLVEIMQMVFLAQRLFFRISYVVSSGNSGISKNKATSLWHFGPNSAVRKFRHGKSVALSYIPRIMFNHNCQTAGVHENKTIFRPSNIARESVTGTSAGFWLGGLNAPLPPEA